MADRCAAFRTELLLKIPMGAAHRAFFAHKSHVSTQKSGLGLKCLAGAEKRLVVYDHVSQTLDMP